MNKDHLHDPHSDIRTPQFLAMRQYALGQMQIAHRDYLRQRPEPKCVVYVVIKMTNGHIYVGMTSIGAAKRMQRHCSSAESGRLSTRFARAIRKYGRQNFNLIVVHRCNDATEARRHEVWLVDDLKPEYNLTLGGEGVHGLRMSDSAKLKMRAAKLRNPRSREIAARAAAVVSIPVICLTDGVRYPSAASAGRSYSLSHGTIIGLCRGRHKSRTRGLEFRFDVQ